MIDGDMIFTLFVTLKALKRAFKLKTWTLKFKLLKIDLKINPSKSKFAILTKTPLQTIKLLR